MKAVAAHLKLNRNMSDRQVASFLSVGAEDTPILVGLGDGSTQPLPPLSATAVQRAVSQVRTSGHMKPDGRTTRASRPETRLFSCCNHRCRIIGFRISSVVSCSRVKGTRVSGLGFHHSPPISVGPHCILPLAPPVAGPPRALSAVHSVRLLSSPTSTAERASCRNTTLPLSCTEDANGTRQPPPSTETAASSCDGSAK
eukprot:CAMPEP_0169441924 /NCGR_PEP_ID=MMETSP1042-20121227/8549_1 /TAXON_ID=464988 /ORGANISM="Hemiselmis andersenii, Strain CCMP1180" /LENGTH=198 /DNA_ID=CAMNT_0009553053 /DNA_START=245 /DNA_END=841 /DNA_ORIENTATION=-